MGSRILFQIKRIVCLCLIILWALPLHAAATVDDLITAVDRNDVAKVKELIAAKVDANGKGSKGLTPLTMAAKRGNPDIAKLLLDAGADPNVPDIFGTPIFIAIWGAKPDTRHREAIELLLARGADPKARDPLGNTTLMIAVQTRKLDLAQKFVKLGVNINDFDNEGQTAIFSAVGGRQDAALLEFLLDNGADVKVKNKFGIGPLGIAACLRNPVAVRMLLDHGASVEESYGVFSWTPLLAVMLCGTSEMNADGEDVIKILVERGANVNARMLDEEDPYAGFTPLMGAAMRGSARAVKMLLEKGAKVDYSISLKPGSERAANDNGYTPLMAAAYSDKTEVIDLLLRHGADINARTKRGITAVMIASTYGHTDAYNYLLSKGATITESEKKLAKLESLKEYRSQLELDLTWAYNKLKRRVTNSPEYVLNSKEDCRKMGIIFLEEISFVRAQCTKDKCEIVLRHEKLTAKNSTAAVGLKTGEGKITGVIKSDKTKIILPKVWVK